MNAKEKFELLNFVLPIIRRIETKRERIKAAIDVAGQIGLDKKLLLRALKNVSQYGAVARRD